VVHTLRSVIASLTQNMFVNRILRWLCLEVGVKFAFFGRGVTHLLHSDDDDNDDDDDDDNMTLLCTVFC